MKIRVDSFEYKCWHEVGHAAVCLHLGGDVDLIEFLSGDARGHARCCCVVTPEIQKTVACGGFAAEYYLLVKGYAEKDENDARDISQIVFHNALADRQDFWGRILGLDETFSTEEDEKFMQHAIQTAAPIFVQYFSQMHALVQDLKDAKRIDGRRVRALLLPRSSHQH